MTGGTTLESYLGREIADMFQDAVGVGMSVQVCASGTASLFSWVSVKGFHVILESL